MIKFGTFLLMQSPSARSSQEIYARAVEIAQAAETLGFRSVWLAEHRGRRSSRRTSPPRPPRSASAPRSSWYRSTIR
jgi:alkanesulfonate monooxygenase SsuD/methylene tetrahydromethanopterin reductase-like flavin-dependent oxidoreductase (luciferase family)